MNDSLLTYSGGQPLYADDLSFMQNSLSAMTNHLSKAFGDTYIVWGCLDEGKTNVVEGAVCIGGKLYEVPALGTLGENKLCYREVLSDERVFEDGQTRSVKKSYEAYLSTDTSGAVAYIDLKTARNVSSWAQEEWDDTPYIELSSIATSSGWFDAKVKRIRTIGGWLYCVSVKCKKADYSQASASIGQIKGVSINNMINVTSHIHYEDDSQATLIAVQITPYSVKYTPQYITTYIPDTTYSQKWRGIPATLKSNFLLQFSFFDADVKVAYAPSEVDFG